MLPPVTVELSVKLTQSGVQPDNLSATKVTLGEGAVVIVAVPCADATVQPSVKVTV